MSSHICLLIPLIMNYNSILETLQNMKQVGVLVCFLLIKSNLGIKGFISHYSSSEEKRGQILKAGVQILKWSRGHGGGLITGFLSMACSVCFLLIQFRTTIARVLFAKVDRQENAQQSYLQDNFMVEICKTKI